MFNFASVALVGLLACSAFAQLGRSPYADIVNYRSEYNNEGNGNYNYLWENSDGAISEQRGYQKPPNPGTSESIQVAEGSYQWFSPEGELIRVNYIADENGFQPSSDSLPTPPPIPPAIQKALDIIYAGIARQKNEQELQALAAERRRYNSKK